MRVKMPPGRDRACHTEFEKFSTLRTRPAMRGRRTATTYRTGPMQLEQPETDPTRPSRPNASNGRTSQPLGGADDDVSTTVIQTTQQPHLRTSRNRAHRETTAPTRNKQRRDNYSYQKRPARTIRATTQLRRADHRRTNADKPTPRTGHAPGRGTYTAPDRQAARTLRTSRKATKTTSDYIGAGYTTSSRSNCCRTTTRQ